jgi:predicted TIM-barrel enzyme
MIRDLFLRELRDLGFAGIQNFPTVGLIDGTFRANLEETGMGFQAEIDCVAAAHELELLTTPYVFNTDDAVKMTRAGADILVAHMGLTTAGTIGAKTARSLDDCVKVINDIVSAAKGVRADVLTLCHGGPIAEPAEASYIIERCPGVDGFYGASSMERLPAERAITEQTRQFVQIKPGRK